MKYPFILIFVSVLLSTLLCAWLLRVAIVEAQILINRYQRPQPVRARRSRLHR